MSGTKPVTSFPEFGKPFDTSVLQQLGNPNLAPIETPCKLPDPAADCYAACNTQVKQFNFNCKAALKLYVQYLKEQGCKVGSCTFKPLAGCKNKGNSKICSAPAPTGNNTGTRRARTMRAAKYSYRR